MNRTHILLSALLLPIAFVAYGQAPVDQNVQQLKDSWYKKVNELAELGEKIDEKHKLIIILQKEIRLLITENIENYSEKNKSAFDKAYLLMVRNFYKKFFKAIRDDVNVKGFLMQELIDNKGDFFKNNNDGSIANKNYCTGILDSMKLNFIQIIVEGNVLKKLLDDYEECLQKMAEIDHELKLLGQPTLLLD